MQFVVLDLETYFDKDYTLKKLTTEAYCRDPRFEAHGAAIKWGKDHAAKWYDARFLPQVLKDHDWSNTFLIAHHQQFDGLILSHHYGVVPRMYGCTLSMFRMLLGNHLSVGLDPLRKHYGMPAKRTPYERMIGQHWHEMDEATKQEVAEGACDEVESIWRLFELALREGFPASELEVIDMTVRMFTQPVLRADVPLLQKVWEDEERRKVELRASIGASEPELQSAARFCELLTAAGVEPVYKNGKNGQIPALAKTDDFMRDLLEHEDEYVRALAEARIGAKSTLLQSRAEHLGFMAQRGDLCIYLRYCGAHTTRWSGGDSTNFQNFKRGSDLRRAVLAPDGYKILVIDLAQTEARLTDFLAGNTWAIEAWRRGDDLYSLGASAFYGYEVNRDDYPNERQAFKVVKLQCGFGSGGLKIARTLRNGVPSVIITEEEGERMKESFRYENRAVVDSWTEAGNMLPWIAGKLETEWGPTPIKDGKLYLPNGTRINYDTMEYCTEPDKKGFPTGYRFKTRQGWSRVWGSKLVENRIQALARVQMSDAMIRLNRAGFRPVMTSHDDVAVLVKDDQHVDEAVAFCVEQVKKTPEWLPGIPLDAEATVGQRYEK